MTSPSIGNAELKVSKAWFLYMIETDKNQLYIGITTDIDRRWKEHCAVAAGLKNAKGAKFFRGKMPKTIVYRESFPNRSEASKREAELKKYSRTEKLALIK